MQNASALDDAKASHLTTFESRLIRVLGLLLVQERTQGDQVDLLTRAGFGATEIAEMLSITPNAVRVARYQNKQERKKKKTKKANR